LNFVHIAARITKIIVFFCRNSCIFHRIMYTKDATNFLESILHGGEYFWEV
jgi:hypothetical protein